MNARFLALDLGAESGRAVVGESGDGRLGMREVHRFANQPVRQNGGLRWDIQRLWQDVRRALDGVGDGRLTSVGVDSWGCDFGLLDERGDLLENPYHYRDARTDEVMQTVTALVSPERIYGTTGVQFLPFNTLYQLYAACQQTPLVIESAASLAMIPDLLNYWLTGELRSELTIASTTQFVDARTREWATDLLRELAIPTRLLPPLVEPGTLLGGVCESASAGQQGTQVVAPACHDTGSAVASVAAGGRVAFLSSGTWSLLGTELPAPMVSERARIMNFTNEGGVCGTTRLLKNIAGLWLLQACRRGWAEAGHDLACDELITAAADDRLAFRSLIDPDCADFLHPGDMAASIAAYCRQTAQAEPSGPPAYARAIFESLAFKYRHVLDALETITGTGFEQIRVVGGGARNRLLNQFTADATGRTVIAGPVEATALGNIVMQMLATGHVSSLEEARAVVERSFPVDRYEPSNPALWDRHYARFLEDVELTRA